MDLAVQTREKLGKVVKTLRRDGFIPAELYGHGVENIHLTVVGKDFNKIFKEAGTNTVVNLILGSEKKPAIIHDIEKNYLSGEISHIDFHQIKMDEKIRTSVPIEFIGEAPAVKDLGAIINKGLSEIEIEAFPGDIPHSFKVDISVLDEIDKGIHIKDIKVPSGVEIIDEDESVIVSVMVPRVEEEVVEAAPDVSEVKVESEEKKAERDSEKTEKEGGE